MTQSEMEKKTIEIPEGYEARIEGNKVILELKESENEKIRNLLYCLIRDRSDNGKLLEHNGVSVDMALAWIEKQGKQSPITFNDAHIIDSALNDYCCKQYSALHKENGGVLSFARLQHLAMDIYGWCEKQTLANSAKTCKVEPKFKVGDWVVYDGQVTQILQVCQDGYVNIHQGFIPKEREEIMRLWTIQDAKDGDVLAEHETIVLFKEIDGLNIRCYCTYHYLGYNPTFYVDTLHNKTPYRPATKEQRDLLLQKMKEAGYELDAEKKELRKKGE